MCTQISRKMIVCIGWVVIAFLYTGCDSRPSAPVLRDSPVYHSRQEGFRFLVPDGWSQLANSVLPRGELEGETFLVRYRMRTPEEGSVLQVVVSSASLTDNLQEHHSEPSYRVEKWKLTESNEDLEIGGAAAVRYIYAAPLDGRSMTKEVVCFERNNRIYNFVGLFWSNDDKAREQVRRAVGSTIWEN